MRSLLAIFIAVLLLGVAVAEDVTQLLEKFKDIDHARSELFKRLHPNGAPDLSKLKKAGGKSPISLGKGDYSSAGFIAMSLFVDNQCSDAVMTQGQPVNTCNVDVGFAFIIRLVKDSCAGGYIEYYYDKKCTDYAGSSDLSDSKSLIPCAEFLPGSGIFMGTVCTTSSQPKVYSQSVVIQYYRGDGCGSVRDMYMALPANKCSEGSEDDDFGEDSMFTCDAGGVQQLSFTAGSNCKKRTSSFSLPTTCMPSSDPNVDDDDNDDAGGDDDDADDDGSGNRGAALLPPRVRGRSISAAKARAKAQAKASLRTSDSKQALALVPTDDDVNYGDDGNADDDRTYSYDDGTYSSGHADDDRIFSYAYADDGGGLLNPPPSVSTTPFPTTTAEANAAFSLKVACQAAPKKEDVVFTAEQTIKGVSFSDYTDNKAAYEKTFKQAIASAITGATEDSITNLVVTDPSATAAGISIAQAPAHFIKRLLSGSSITITYTVTVSGTTLSADTLMSQLVTAVESGTFTESMQSYAAENGADGLETASSDSVTTEREDDEETATLSMGGIIGIAVGVGVPVLAGIVFTIVCFCARKRVMPVGPQ